jgi:hypothetical protein
MIRFTKKQRKEIYYKAYLMLEKLETIKDYDRRLQSNVSEYCCDNINFILSEDYCKPSDVKTKCNNKTFPEFYLFEKETMNWFSDNNDKDTYPELNLEVQAIRKTALLLAMEMCN